MRGTLLAARGPSTAPSARRLHALSVCALLAPAACLNAAAPLRRQHAPQPPLQHAAAPLPLSSCRRVECAPQLSLQQTEEETNTGFASFLRPSMFSREPPEPEPEPEPEEASSGLATAGGALATSAVVAEGVQIAGTAVLLYLGQGWTGTDSPVELIAYMIDFLQKSGAAGYGYFAAAMITLQVVPIAAAFILTVSAGAIFGAVKGTAMVLSCSTISASISFLIARAFGRERLMDVAQENKQFRAIDAAFGDASFSTSLTLITLLRLSPVLPFAWANYVFGLSPVPLPAFSIGTFVGCLPAVAGYVSAGQAGAEIAVNGADSNPVVLGLGVAATIGAITVAGNIATSALKDLDLDLEE